MITWFAPAPSKTPAYQVLDSGSGACGTLAKADNGQYKLTSDTAVSSVLLTKAQIKTLQVVPDCA